MTTSNKDGKPPVAPAESPAEKVAAKSGPADASASATDTETPIQRAIRQGQGDVVNPAIPTGQTPEQMRDELVAPDSNEQLHIAARKREAADGTYRGDKSDERGFTQR